MLSLTMRNSVVSFNSREISVRRLKSSLLPKESARRPRSKSMGSDVAISCVQKDDLPPISHLFRSFVIELYVVAVSLRLLSSLCTSCMLLLYRVSMSGVCLFRELKRICYKQRGEMYNALEPSNPFLRLFLRCARSASVWTWKDLSLRHHRRLRGTYGGL